MIHTCDCLRGRGHVTTAPRDCTTTLQGVKKTKLGLREFIKLGDFIQQIDVQNSVAVSCKLATRAV